MFRVINEKAIIVQGVIGSFFEKIIVNIEALWTQVCPRVNANKNSSIFVLVCLNKGLSCFCKNLLL